MNGRTAKKIRQYSKRHWREHIKAIEKWPFTMRVKFAFHIIFLKGRSV